MPYGILRCLGLRCMGLGLPQGKSEEKSTTVFWRAGKLESKSGSRARRARNLLCSEKKLSRDFAKGVAGTVSLPNFSVSFRFLPFFRRAPDPFNFLRHVMRAIWSVRPKCSHRCVSLKETPLKPVQSLRHTQPKTQRSKPLWERNGLNISRFNLSVFFLFFFFRFLPFRFQRKKTGERPFARPLLRAKPRLRHININFLVWLVLGRHRECPRDKPKFSPGTSPVCSRDNPGDEGRQKKFMS